jgi:hypothetical protein
LPDRVRQTNDSLHGRRDQAKIHPLFHPKAKMCSTHPVQAACLPTLPRPLSALPPRPSSAHPVRSLSARLAEVIVCLIVEAAVRALAEVAVHLPAQDGEEVPGVGFDSSRTPPYSS